MLHELLRLTIFSFLDLSGGQVGKNKWEKYDNKKTDRIDDKDQNNGKEAARPQQHEGTLRGSSGDVKKLSWSLDIHGCPSRLQQPVDGVLLRQGRPLCRGTSGSRRRWCKGTAVSKDVFPRYEKDVSIAFS